MSAAGALRLVRRGEQSASGRHVGSTTRRVQPPRPIGENAHLWWPRCSSRPGRVVRATPASKTPHDRDKAGSVERTVSARHCTSSRHGSRPPPAVSVVTARRSTTTHCWTEAVPASMWCRRGPSRRVGNIFHTFGAGTVSRCIPRWCPSGRRVWQAARPSFEASSGPTQQQVADISDGPQGEASPSPAGRLDQTSWRMRAAGRGPPATPSLQLDGRGQERARLFLLASMRTNVDHTTPFDVIDLPLSPRGLDGGGVAVENIAARREMTTRRCRRCFTHPEVASDGLTEAQQGASHEGRWGLSFAANGCAVTYGDRTASSRSSRAK